MCSEARGLKSWPRTAARWLVLLAAVTLALTALIASHGSAFGADPKPAPVSAPAPSPSSADEPLAPACSPANAAAYLDAVALDWTRNRKCGRVTQTMRISSRDRF